MPVIDSPNLLGRRVVQMVDGVERRDLRAVTDLYSNAEGDICLRVAAELDWYRWTWTGQLPKNHGSPGPSRLARMNQSSRRAPHTRHSS